MIFYLEESVSIKKIHLLKIQQQFGHSSISNIKKLIRNTGYLVSKLSKIVHVIYKYEVCIKY